MLIRTVTTVSALNSAGQVVEALPVREAVTGETDIVGRPVTPIDVVEDVNGVPVRFVTGKSAANSAGQVVDTIAVKGVSSYVPTGTLLGGWETLSEWTNTAQVASLNPSARVQGDNAVKYSQTANISGLNVRKSIDIDPATLDTFGFYARLDDDFDWQNWAGLTLNILLNGTGTIYAGPTKSTLSNAYTGGVWITGNVSQMNALVAAAGMGSHQFRVSGTSASAGAGDVTLDASYCAIGGKAGVLLTFDDAKISQRTVAAEIMAANGLVGEALIPAGKIEEGGLDVMSWAQTHELETLYGWNIQSGATLNDTALTNLGTVEAAVAAMAANKAALEAQGFRGINAFCYPFGSVRTNGTRIEKTGITTTAGSPIIPMASTTGITVAMRAVMFGVSRSARVLSVEPNVSVTLNENVTTAIASKNAAFVDDSGAFHGRKLTDALRAAGWKWGRTTEAGRDMFCQYGISPDQAIQYPSNPTTGLTLASFQASVNAAKASKSLVAFYFHNIADSGGSATSVAVFTDCMNWLKTEVDADFVENVTTKSLDAKYGNARPPTA